VLTAGALERMRAGDLSGASSALEAAAALTASLRERSETLSRLVAVTLDRRLLGALRLLDPIPAGWAQKLAEIEAQTRPAGALAGETLELLAHVRRPDTTLRGLILEMDIGPPLGESHRSWLSERILSLCGLGVPVERLADAIASEKQQTQTPFFRFVQGPLERPYMRLAVADYATVQVRTASAVASGDSCGPLPLAASRRSPGPLVETGEARSAPRAHGRDPSRRARLTRRRGARSRARSRGGSRGRRTARAESQACPGAASSRSSSMARPRSVSSRRPSPTTRRRSLSGCSADEEAPLADRLRRDPGRHARGPGARAAAPERAQPRQRPAHGRRSQAARPRPGQAPGRRLREGPRPRRGAAALHRRRARSPALPRGGLAALDLERRERRSRRSCSTGDAALVGRADSEAEVEALATGLRAAAWARTVCAGSARGGGRGLRFGLLATVEPPACPEAGSPAPPRLAGR
jgi:hypothetical protein